ncbi:hypothetical protein DCAR_0415611 [Daucus carota subsp. sativus]|uniref:Delta(3)-Delta(2)-enoyl-CoA isomerase n=1 Tax=Daucus carota subsp. sativus TaxID=79200 RepID=A0AAF0WUF0_DAUCS|nr:hypothetical protein DCAR_0415611 [Daucus carota subsp. sativus]
MCTLEKRGSIYFLTLTGSDDHRLNPSLADSISAALHRIRCEFTATPSTSAALVTTGEGKYFSNGIDIAWAQSNKQRFFIMMSKIRHLLTQLMSLPMPTIAAVNGHASGIGYILALSHDYVFMRKDHGFLYMSEVDRGVVITATYVWATLKAKISSPSVLRDIVLRAEKVTAEAAVTKNIIDAAYDTVEETVTAAVELGKELASQKWDGQVYAENKKYLYSTVLHELAVVETDKMLQDSRLLTKQVMSRL